MTRLGLTLSFTLSLTLIGGSAPAHGVETRTLTTGAVAVEFRFTDGTTMALADAMAFAPGHPNEPSVTGRTDEHGRHAFPDWLVAVSLVFNVLAAALLGRRRSTKVAKT
jgi:hypothetical protein